MNSIATLLIAIGIADMVGDKWRVRAGVVCLTVVLVTVLSGTTSIGAIVLQGLVVIGALGWISSSHGTTSPPRRRTGVLPLSILAGA